MNVTTIIVAIIGGIGGICAGIVSILKFVSERKDLKEQRSIENILDDKLSPIISCLDKLDKHRSKQDKELKETRLDTTRIQLMMLIEHQPYNHDTIIKVAERYFLELDGNWIMAAEFLDWSEKEKVKVSPLLIEAIEKNHKVKV